VDWVIVRPAALSNSPRTGSYKAGFAVTDKTITAKISRADVADFMLRQLTGTEYRGKTPGVSY
jgi:putative NADH-flavin reductase